LYAEAAAAGVDFYCCGHTHGGQIRIPGLPPPVYNAACPRALAAGPWRVGAMVGYTSRGVGASGVPARFCCPPEITVLELRSATAETAGCRVVRNHGLVTGSSVAARGV
jgi:predicted MPP superfamily phosphohydrolase